MFPSLSLMFSKPASRAERWWKMTRPDKHMSNVPPYRRQQRGKSAVFNLIAGLFLSAVLTADTGGHGLRKLQKCDGVRTYQSNSSEKQCNNTTMKGKINGLTHDDCLL